MAQIVEVGMRFRFVRANSMKLKFATLRNGGGGGEGGEGDTK